MWTIAGGIILGFLGLGLIRSLFGGPSRAELLNTRVRQMELEEQEAERRIRLRERD